MRETLGSRRCSIAPSRSRRAHVAVNIGPRRPRGYQEMRQFASRARRASAATPKPSVHRPRRASPPPWRRRARAAQRGTRRLRLQGYRYRDLLPLLGGGQPDLGGGALADAAFEQQHAAGLLGQALHHREAEPGALADTLGREERLLGMPERLLV